MASTSQLSSQNLECSICLTLFNQPKSLECSHTFCKDCLERIFQTQANQSSILCPVCRKETSAPNGDVGKLPTNVPLCSLVDEMNTESPTCTHCETDEKLPAVSYCQDCREKMCTPCEKHHSGWFSNHEVVAMSEVLSGNVPLKRRRKCKEHPYVEEDCFCPGCREYVCVKCGLLEHSQEGHGMIKASTHEKNLIEKIEDLQKRAKFKKTVVEEHIEFIEKQCTEIKDMMAQLNNGIDKKYETYMQLLPARREALRYEVRKLSEKFEKALNVMAENDRRTIDHIKAAEELVGNGMKVPVGKDALNTHDSLCKRLEKILRRRNPNDQSLRNVRERAEKISFRKYSHEIFLGKVEGYMDTFDLKSDLQLPCKLCMSCMTLSPDGTITVGCLSGGIKLFSPDGKLQETVLADIVTSRIAIMSDGRSVVCDIHNNVSLCTKQWEKLPVDFETRSFAGEGIGGITVDRDDNIYMGYPCCEKIKVFTPRGGGAVREIMCQGISPWQLFTFQSKENLIVTDERNVVCLDSEGNKEYVLEERNGTSAFPAVCRDDSVIVAWVTEKSGLVSIDRYTSEFEHVQNLVSDFKIPKSKYQCYLQEFKGGEIAFCTMERLYIFHST